MPEDPHSCEQSLSGRGGWGVLYSGRVAVPAVPQVALSGSSPAAGLSMTCLSSGGGLRQVAFCTTSDGGVPVVGMAASAASS